MVSSQKAMAQLVASKPAMVQAEKVLTETQNIAEEFKNRGFSQEEAKIIKDEEQFFIKHIASAHSRLKVKQLAQRTYLRTFKNLWDHSISFKLCLGTMIILGIICIAGIVAMGGSIGPSVILFTSYLVISGMLWAPIFLPQAICDPFNLNMFIQKNLNRNISKGALSLQETIFHETVHSALQIDDDNIVLYALEAVRFKDYPHILDTSRDFLMPVRKDGIKLSKRALLLAHETGNPDDSFLFLRFIAEGKNEKEAEKLVRNDHVDVLNQTPKATEKRG